MLLRRHFFDVAMATTMTATRFYGNDHDALLKVELRKE